METGYNIRFWDKQNKQMVYSSDKLKITNEGVFRLDSSDNQERWNFIPYNNNMVPLRSIGKIGFDNDMNRCIYEGDLLRDESGVIGYVIYCSDKCRFMIQCPNSMLPISNSYNVILGNVYENLYEYNSL